jgi:isoleucyl-tRNA synthetase
MHRTVATLAKLLAPVVPFTAEEVWSFLSGREAESVHLTEFPSVDARLRDEKLEARWEKLLQVRSAAALELEKARQAGTIGKSLEAQVEIEADSPATQELLQGVGPLLETVLIVSQAKVGKLTEGQLRVKVTPAEGQKCVRCWRWTHDVGQNSAHPQLCGRCTDVVSQKVVKGDVRA